MQVNRVPKKLVVSLFLSGDQMLLDLVRSNRLPKHISCYAVERNTIKLYLAPHSQFRETSNGEIEFKHEKKAVMRFSADKVICIYTEDGKGTMVFLWRRKK